MYHDDPALEQRLSRFEAQLDRFNLALRQWQRTQADPHPTTFPEVEQRLQALEQTLGREVRSLRQMQEGSLRQLESQAATLRELCAAASQSLSGLEHRESGLADLQQHIRQTLGEVASSLQALVADLRTGAPSGVVTRDSAASWPLEGVVRLHDSLRHAAGMTGDSVTAEEERARESGVAVLSPYPVSRSSLRVDDSPHRVRAVEPVPPRDNGPGSSSTPTPRAWYIAGILAGAVVLLAVVVAVRLESRMRDATARVTTAEQQVVATTQLANREVAAARESADRQIAEARDVAQRAETVSVILTAPDLIRFNLTSAFADGSAAQLLWSRTRGLVLSGSRLPPLPAKTTYQLWLVTNTRSISAGLFVPDADGRATLIVDEPLKVPGRVVGATVTLEPAGGRLSPSGPTLLARLPQPAL